MWRIIFRMLSARRNRFGWLMAELVIVTIAVWVLIDSIIVQSFIERQYKGFDEQHLYSIELKQHPQDSPHFVSRKYEQMNDDRWLLLQMVRNYKGISSATFQGFLAPFSMSSSSTTVKSDTLTATVFNMEFVPRSDFFTTFCFSETGRLGCADNDRMTFEDGGVVMSEGAFPGRTSMGLVDTFSMTKVVSTIGMVRMRPGMPALPVRMIPQPNMNVNAIVFRVEENIDGEKFRAAFNEWAQKQLKAGNYYVGELQTYSEYIDAANTEVAVFMDTRIILGLFFLFCLIIGVSGSFWMQTDSRREEIGIMKSFGATSGYIMRTFIIEGVILATLAVILGCFIYMQYAMQKGLYTPLDNWGNNIYGLLAGHYWFEHFIPHFVIVSLATWAIVIIVVSLGIYIPASNISRITPTDALQDE